MPITFDEVNVEVAGREATRDATTTQAQSATPATDPRDQLEALLRLHAERALRIAAD